MIFINSGKRYTTINKSKNYKLVIYLPEYCETVVSSLAYKYGGCTVILGKGSWLDEQDKIIQEDIYLYQVFSDLDSYTKNADWLYKYLEFLKSSFNQKCLVYEVNNVLHSI